MNIRAISLFLNKISGVTRNLYLMCGHNVTSSSLSIIAEIMYVRSRTYQITEFSSIMQKSPLLSLFLLLMLFANISLPLTAGFVSKYVIFSDITKQGYILLVLIPFYMLISTSASIWLRSRLLFGSSFTKYRSDIQRSTQFIDLIKQETILQLLCAIMIVSLSIFIKPTINLIDTYSYTKL